MTNDTNDLSKQNLGNEKTNGNNNEPIRNPILSQSVNNANISNNGNIASNGMGNVDQVLPGMENLTQNNPVPGAGDAQQLPEMQNFSNQSNIDNNGQSVFLDQQGFDQMNYGDQTAYNQSQMNMNPMENGGYQQNNNYMQGPEMYQQNGQNQAYGQNSLNQVEAQGAFGQNDFNQGQAEYQQNSFNQGAYNQNNYQQNGYDQNMYQQNSYEQNQYAQANNSYSAEANANSAQSHDESDYNLAFVQNWMGKIYEKAHSKKFNVAAALLGEAYLLYRKVYIPGMLFLVISLLLSVCACITGNSLFEIILAIYFVVRFFALGFGFYPMYRSNVRKELNKYKSQTQDNNELINKAKKNGGTSIVALIICLVIELIVLGIGTSMVLKNTPGANSRNNNTNNSANEVATNSQEVFFEKGYVITYDSNKWFYTPANSTFTQGDYKLEYKVKYTEQQLGLDFASADGRSALLSLLTNSFNAQAAQSNLQAEVANSTFIAKFTSYYAYIDIISSTSISRYYFVILPDEKVMFQFVLEANDTAIDYTTNLDVIDMISLITPATEEENQNNANTISNDVTSGNTVAGNTVSSNTVSNATENGTLSSTASSDTNEVSGDVRNALSNDNASSQMGNTTSSSNAGVASSSNNTTSSNSRTQGNATQASSSSSLASLVQ